MPDRAHVNVVHVPVGEDVVVEVNVGKKETEGETDAL